MALIWDCIKEGLFTVERITFCCERSRFTWLETFGGCECCSSSKLSLYYWLFLFELVSSRWPRPKIVSGLERIVLLFRFFSNSRVIVKSREDIFLLYFRFKWPKWSRLYTWNARVIAQVSLHLPVVARFEPELHFSCRLNVLK